MLDLAKLRAEGGCTSRDKGGEGRGGVTLVETRVVRLGFAKSSTQVLDLAKPRAEVGLH